MTRNEALFTFLAGVAVSLSSSLVLTLNPRAFRIFTSSTRQWAFVALALSVTGAWLMLEAAMRSGKAAERRVSQGGDRAGTEHEDGLKVRSFGYGGLVLTILALIASIVDQGRPQ